MLRCVSLSTSDFVWTSPLHPPPEVSAPDGLAVEAQIRSLPAGALSACRVVRKCVPPSQGELRRRTHITHRYRRQPQRYSDRQPRGSARGRVSGSDRRALQRRLVPRRGDHRVDAHTRRPARRGERGTVEAIAMSKCLLCKVVAASTMAGRRERDEGTGME